MADATGACRVTLWQDDIGRLEEDTSYQLDNFVINSFANVKYLSPQKTDSPCDIHAIADIGTVDNTEPLSSNTVIANAEVTGVSYIGTHNACLSCKAKVDPLNDVIGVCTKCTMSQKLSKCDKQLSAKLVIGTPNSSRRFLAYDQENSRRRHDHQFNEQTRSHYSNSYG